MQKILTVCKNKVKKFRQAPISFKVSYCLGSICILSVLLQLSHWQYNRGKHKQYISQQMQYKLAGNAITFEELENKLKKYSVQELRYNKIILSGRLQPKSLLLDNQILFKQVGYRVLTPFKITTLNKHVLIDRGFISKQDFSKNFQNNPFPGVATEITVAGIINTPTSGILLKKDQPIAINANTVIQSVDFKLLESISNYAFLPITIQTKDKNLVFTYVEPKLPTTSEKHFGYAVQWLILAAIFLVFIFFAL